MNRYPWWANLLIALVLAAGRPVCVAEPGTAPIRRCRFPASAGGRWMRSTTEKITAALKAAGVSAKSLTPSADGVTLRFADTDQQLKAQDAVRDTLGQDYTVALNLVPAAPAWLSAHRCAADVPGSGPARRRAFPDGSGHRVCGARGRGAAGR